ncbi:MAG: peptidoglycan DD-metalloendopeptidase family protein, partial [Nitriliruptoraceae bacterium]
MGTTLPKVRRRRRSRAVVVPTIVALVVLATATSMALADDLDELRGRSDELEDELDATVVEEERLIGEIARTEEDLERLEQQEEELKERAAELDAALEDRAREMFIRGAGADLELVLASQGPEAAVERAALVEALQTRERASLEEATAARRSLDQVTQLAEQRREELTELTAELEQRASELENELGTVRTQVDALESLAARQREIDQGDQQGTYACPLDPGVTRFTDSWGAPRSGGRSHKGTDIMGPMGSPVYAFTDGVIARHSSGGLGGLSIYLRGDDGQTYYYAHLQGYADAGAVGNRVEAGEQIAYNGDTGNARGGAPHVH